LNANPNRVYIDSVLAAYGLDVNQLNKLGWSGNEKQYVMYLCSSVPIPIRTD